MGFVWGAAVLVVLVFGGFAQPAEALGDVLASGVNERSAAVLGFVAGFTLPLTVGVAIMTLTALTGAARPRPLLFWGALGLAALGWLSSELRLGLPPTFSGRIRPGSRRPT